MTGSTCSSGTPSAREHPLAVVAARRGFDDLGGAGRLEAGQEQRGLHLPAGDRQLARGGRPAARPAPRAAARCPSARPSTCAPRARSGADHPPHGAAGQRGVAGEDGEERPAGERARPACAAWCREFAQSRTRSGSPSASTPRPAIRTGSGGSPVRSTPSAPSAARVRGHVVPVGEAPHHAGPVGERREQQRPVRDPLVAGEAESCPAAAPARRGSARDATVTPAPDRDAW